MDITSELAGIDVADIVDSTLGGDSLQIRRYVEGAAQIDINAGNVRTHTDYGCRGYPADLESLELEESLVRQGTVAFCVYGASLTIIPISGDGLMFDSREHTIYNVARGRTGAVYTILTTPAVP